MTMYQTINEWVDYIDKGCSVLHLDFNVFKKNSHLILRFLKMKVNIRIKFHFKMWHPLIIVQMLAT